MQKSKAHQRNNAHLVVGSDAETKAKTFLIEQGLSYIDQNYFCAFGEIDLIMVDRQTLVFVEVRYRKNSLFGSALESITLRKQQKITNSAQHFIQHNQKYSKWSLRFDALGITGEDMQWVKNAF